MSKVSEQDLAAVVVAWLEAMGADVYQEVEVPGGVADIVARVHAECWIVEVKASLSLAVICQAIGRCCLAHRVFVAVPYSRNMSDFCELCERLGLGLLQVDVGNGVDDDHYKRVLTRVSSQRWNRRPVALSTQLQPEHKTHARAGAASAAGRWTPFRRTIEQLARLAHEEPGITLKAAIDKIKHHYSTDRSAVSSIAHWLEKGAVPGVELARTHGTHGPLVIRPKEAA